MKRRRHRRIRVVERKLQRDVGGHGKLYGQAFQGMRMIEIDPRQRPRSYFDTLIHECLHLLFPNASESKVAKSAHEMTDVLWRLGFRRVSQ